MPIEFNINNPVVPLSVCYGDISGQIKGVCQSYSIPIPNELKGFVEENSFDESCEWQNNVLLAAEEMDIALLKKWVDTISSSFFRAELRAIYKRRCNENIDMGSLI